MRALIFLKINSDMAKITLQSGICVVSAYIQFLYRRFKDKYIYKYTAYKYTRRCIWQLVIGPHQQRPREKLIQRGANALSDAELLAIFLRTGCAGRSAVDLARRPIRSIW